MGTASFHRIVSRLTEDQTPRVWSLLVTVFGELAQDKGAQISGLMLRHMRDHIGIKPEAMRVALHRLRKDGWIENERTGRTSAHHLTDWGRTQSAAASPRIYSRGATATRAWLIVSDPSQSQPQGRACGVWVSSNLRIATTPPKHTASFVAVLDDAAHIPAWMKNKICSLQTRTASKAFFETLKQVREELAGADPLSTIEHAVLRVLLVHAWRRIILKAPELPDCVFPEDWYGPQCRVLMADLFDHFPKLHLSDLQNAVENAP
ncbi:MAG: PaaX family transcriptional regulator C-terminal domain-containing protein [Ascidiaceihabitans sp.]|uniref:PaaX family transcriptional regulator C-terminal domain-containing protein n=1 Tax=Ascidiaceihabitans sp. TaxID=1872644 RepID=UPI003297221C